MSLKMVAFAAVVAPAACVPLVSCYGVGIIDLRLSEDAGAPLDAGPVVEQDASLPDASVPDAGDCPGVCAPLAPLGEAGWTTPLLLWFGAKEQAPPCPATASDRRWEGYADLVAALDCPACSCAPPTGSCALPTALIAADAMCPGAGPGAMHTPFDPPASWDGSCTTAGAIPAGSGIRSLTFGPLQVIDESCAPRPGGSPKLEPPAWKTYAFACDGHEGRPPCSNGMFCMPAAPPPGFHACIFHMGEASCPKNYPDRHVFFPEDGIADTRACSTCTCAAPFGSECAGLVSVYSDAACHALQAALMMTSGHPQCADLPHADMALGSKSAAKPIYVPGACAPWIGPPTGAARAVQPSTFCCE